MNGSYELMKSFTVDLSLSPTNIPIRSRPSLNKNLDYNGLREGTAYLTIYVFHFSNSWDFVNDGISVQNKEITLHLSE